MIDVRNITVSILSRGQLTQDDNQKMVVDALATLEKVADRIRTSRKLKVQTAALREKLLKGGRKGEYQRAKPWMPAIIPAAHAPKGTRLEKLPPAEYHNSLYGFDIDELRQSIDLPSLRAELIATPGAVMVGMSCAGDALYVVIAGPVAATDDEYKRNWVAIAAGLPETAKANNGPQSKNFNRLRFLAYDPDVWLAEGPLTPVAGAQRPEAPAAHGSRPQIPPEDHAVDVEALWSFPPPDDYDSWLGWLPTLKALSFTIAEAEDWSAQGAKYQPAEVASRWARLWDDDPVKARDKLRGHAHNQGWRKPQAQPRPTHSGHHDEDVGQSNSPTWAAIKELGGLSQYSIARAFALQHQGSLAFDATPGVWRRWNERGEWAEEKDLLPSIAEFIRDAVYELTDADVPRLREWHKKSGIDAVGALAARSMTVVAWDCKPEIVGLPGGLCLNTETGETERAKRDHYLTRFLPASINDTRAAEDMGWWSRFVWDALEHYEDPDERRAVLNYLQEWSGAALTNECQDEALLYLLGGPGTGKTTFAQSLAMSSGGYSVTINGRRITKGHEQHIQWLAGCKGKRLVYIDEVPAGSAWESEDLGNLVSGQIVEANRMRQDSTNFLSEAHVIITGNPRPRASGSSGVWRRLRIIRFTHHPPAEAVTAQGIKEHFRRHSAGVLLWRLEGLRRWIANGRWLQTPDVILRETERYRLEGDPVAMFADECLVRNPATSCTVDEIYKAFKEWSADDDNSPKIPNKRNFGMRLDDLDWPKSERTGHGGRERVRLGVELRVQSLQGRFHPGRSGGAAPDGDVDGDVETAAT